MMFSHGSFNKLSWGRSLVFVPVSSLCKAFHFSFSAIPADVQGMLDFKVLLKTH